MMHQFKVGDVVRVKVGGVNSGKWTPDAINELKGKRLTVTEANEEYAYISGGGWYQERFEPWNDAEEWDGEKWVPKKATYAFNGDEWTQVGEPSQPKPAIVILREDRVLKPNKPPVVHESTSKAKEEAKRFAELHKGKEFVVFQEVDRKQVEKLKSPVLCGKVVTVVADGHKQEFYVTGTVFNGDGLRSANIMPVGEPCKA